MNLNFTPHEVLVSATLEDEHQILATLVLTAQGHD